MRELPPVENRQKLGKCGKCAKLAVKKRMNKNVINKKCVRSDEVDIMKSSGVVETKFAVSAVADTSGITGTRVGTRSTLAYVTHRLLQ